MICFSSWQRNVCFSIMAFHIRKLKHTLRIIPNTKSVGFSTHVSEGDHRKNHNADGSSLNSNIDGGQLKLHRLTNIDETALRLVEAHSRNSTHRVCTLFRSPSDSELLYNLQPLLPVQTPNLPVVYKDIDQGLLPRISNEVFSRYTDKDSFDDEDPILSVMKSVRFTNDDILVHLADLSIDSNTTISTREHIPIDVLAQHHYRRLAFETALSVHDSLVLKDNSTHVYTCTQTGQPSTHVYYSGNGGSNSGKKGNSSSKNGPSPEQMHEAKEKLEQLVINLFKGHHNYELLHKQVVMENNLFGDNSTSIGVMGYKMELLKLRLRIRTRLFSTSMEILSITTLEQTGVIRIHWRLKGLPQVHNLKFWKVFQSQETISKEDWEWLEAFSYFHIGKDGLVHKHRIDRMMPDDNQPDLTEKLRGLLNPAKPLVN